MQTRIGILVLAWLSAGLTNSAWAQALNPADYASLGSSFTGGIIDTNTATINGSIQGIFVNNIAVFTFDQIVIGSGSSVTASGAKPFALLSKSNISVLGTGLVAIEGQSALSLNAGGLGGPGGGNGGDNHQNGFGPGHGWTASNFGGGGGGGFGGYGGAGTHSALGGLSYGDLTVQLMGGSGGAGSAYINGGGGGGAGGLEMAALGDITISSTNGIRATGGAGSNVRAGGGGNGGGVFLVATNITVSGPVNVSGGLGGNGMSEGGGGGGGGHIVLQAWNSLNYDASLLHLEGGTGGFDPGFNMIGQPGQNGLLTIVAVPEPVSVIISSGALMIGASILFRRSRRKHRRTRQQQNRSSSTLQ